MIRPVPVHRAICVAAAVWLTVSVVRPAGAGGFDFPQQGARAMGMADAATAQAADPTVIFYNAGGLALVEEKKVAVGVTAYELNQGLYQGLAPGPGAGTTGEQGSVGLLAPHLYLSKKLGDRLVLGLGGFSPFALETSWQDPDVFAGRFVSLESEIVTYDLNPTLAWKATPRLGLGAGFVYRAASLELTRRFPITLDGEVYDAATLAVDTSFDDGFGWNAGILYRGERVSWGLAYRSAIEVDFDGEARLTQEPTGDPQIDQLVAASLPIGTDLSVLSSLELPDTLSAGLAFTLGKASVLELDVVRTGWSSFQELPLVFPGDPILDSSIPQDLEDSMSYRAGFAHRLVSGWEWRLGASYDESPQPDPTVGPFLPDADRFGLSLGIGRDWLDLALLYQQLDERTVTDSVFDVNGRWRTNAWMAALTISH